MQVVNVRLENKKFKYSLGEANFIEPGKRPISSMCPAIILDENDDPRLIIGSSGGTRIVTAVALVYKLLLTIYSAQFIQFA